MLTQSLGVETERTATTKLFPNQHILIAADTSTPALWVLEAGGKLASQFDCDQSVVYVAPPLSANEPEVARLLDESEIARLATDQRVIDDLPVHCADGRSLRRLLRRGQAVKKILSTARQTQPDLLVVGTHGRHGLKRLLLGSVATEVLRHATCPVLCVGHAPAPEIGRRIVLGVDFDQASHDAARWAGFLAKQTGGQILVVHAVPPPAVVQPGYGLVSDDLVQHHRRLAGHLLEEFKAHLPGDCDTHVQLCDGPAGAMLSNFAQAWHADLIIVGHSASSALKRAFLGSSTEAVLRRAECPVLCVSH